MAIVYLLTNKENGKLYVGKTVQSFDVCWGGHVGSARRSDNGMLVCRAIKKHGPEAFERKILEECDESVLGGRETHWIVELKTHVSQGGYNLTFGGDGGLPGYTFSEESREKMRQKALGRKLSLEARAKISAVHRGRPKSPEEVEARAKSNRGKKRTPEQIERLRAGQLEYYRKRREARSKQETN
jgi:group I intron endonuclease